MADDPPSQVELIPEPDEGPVTRRRVLALLTGAGAAWLAAPHVEPAAKAVAHFDYQGAFDRLAERLRTRLRQPMEIPGAAEYTAFLASLGVTGWLADTMLRAHARRREGVDNHLPPRELWRNVAAPLEVARAIGRRLGEPRFAIHSAYRSPEYNAKCPGAARHSQHLQNRALDLAFDAAPAQVAAVARQLREEGVFRGGVGLYKTFVHIDTRGRNADW